MCTDTAADVAPDESTSDYSKDGSVASSSAYKSNEDKDDEIDEDVEPLKGVTAELPDCKDTCESESFVTRLPERRRWMLRNRAAG